ncbi:M28 family peptidase [Chitinispirillales bacterium ANBcel5]|uniref:M28 family peptidase n=1 Tax=Cellulosispirillum alkaliphilum TaxID=3039283 RepID=UPI002A532966|nr:M28 family peptidase [Chitinispirillales bacterium ANBcel5]
MNDNLYSKSVNYMKTLCEKIPERSIGSEGNREATRYFKTIMSSFGWRTDIQEFDAIDWVDGGATLTVGNSGYDVLVSPYSLSFSGKRQLTSVSTIEELKNSTFEGKILLLHGEIAKEQLMPKNFVFYNPEEHQQIVSLLEQGNPKAIICATGKNSSVAGGVYPFPLIEDGDFLVPSVYMTEEEGKRLLPHVGKEVQLSSDSKRIPGKGYNVVCKKGSDNSKRVVVTAHIDAKKGTPGAIDNASGVTALLLLAEVLKDYLGDKQIEIVALNGEDYYSVPGQMKYIEKNQGQFESMLMNINIDGAAYKGSNISFSLFELPHELKAKVTALIKKHPDIVEGSPWPQGDHSIFVQYGVPAVAISSQWFIDNMDNQSITHTPKDNLSIIDYGKIVTIAKAVEAFIRSVIIN